MTRITTLKHASLTLAAGVLALAGSMAHAQFSSGDREISGSLCVGLDCVNGESFGFDTIRMKENNLRLHAQDTSSSASFPTVDWRLTFNESSNGGLNKFSVDSVDNSASPFTVEFGASTNALYVEADSDIGLGTKDPVVELHIKDGDSPTIRLEQDGSSGFTPQIFDIAANEANFFVRDVTNGSQLPFKIKPGADSNALFVAANNNIGLSTANPDGPLHIRNASTYITLDDSDNNDIWYITHQAGDDGDFEFTSVLNGGAPTLAMSLTPAGKMTLDAGLKVNNACIELDTLACTFAAGTGQTSCVVGACP